MEVAFGEQGRTNLPRLRLIPTIKTLVYGGFNPSLTNLSRDGLLTLLVLERRRRDPRIKLGSELHWHMAALWDLPEAMIMDVVEKKLVFRSDGFDDQQAVIRIRKSRNLEQREKMPDPADLVMIARHHLNLEFPDYPVKLTPLADHQVHIVEDYFSDHPEQLASEIASCPINWLKNKIPLTDANQEFETCVNERLCLEWQFLMARMKDSDELWTFSSNPNSWKELMGRSGYALVRNGEPVSSVVTVMN